MPLVEDKVEMVLTGAFALNYLVSFIIAAKLLMSDPTDRSGQFAEVKCIICKPPVWADSKHCYTCGRCIEGFDHHCPWLNICIGRRNYRTYLCLISQVLLTILLFCATAVKIGVRLIISAQPWPFAPLLFCGAAACAPLLQMVAMLVIFHSYLVCRGITTYEYWKGKKPRPPSARPLTVEEQRSLRLFHEGAVDVVADATPSPDKCGYPDEPGFLPGSLPREEDRDMMVVIERGLIVHAGHHNACCLAGIDASPTTTVGADSLYLGTIDNIQVADGEKAECVMHITYDMNTTGSFAVDTKPEVDSQCSTSSSQDSLDLEKNMPVESDATAS